MKITNIPGSMGFSEINSEDEEINEKYGLVAVIDALGTRSFKKDETVYFIKSFKNIRELTEKIIFKLVNDLVNIQELKSKTPKLYFFQDTVIITLETNNIQQAEKLLKIFLQMVNLIFTRFFLMKIWVRGSISIGYYFETNNIVLGEAVYDAFDYYESFRMLGVIMTPNVGKILDCIMYELDTPLAIRYKIEVKTQVTNKIDEYWYLGWPLQYAIDVIFQQDIDNIVKPLDYYNRHLINANHDKYSKDIFDNTKHFINYFYAKYPDLNTPIYNDYYFIANSDLDDAQKKDFIQNYILLQDHIPTIMSIYRKVEYSDLINLKNIVSLLTYGFIVNHLGENTNNYIYKHAVNREYIQLLLEEKSNGIKSFLIINIIRNETSFFGFTISSGKGISIIHDFTISDEEYNRLNTLNIKDDQNIEISLTLNNETLLYTFYDETINQIKANNDYDKLIDIIINHKNHLRKENILPLDVYDK